MIRRLNTSSSKNKNIAKYHNFLALKSVIHYVRVSFVVLLLLFVTAVATVDVDDVFFKKKKKQTKKPVHPILVYHRIGISPSSVITFVDNLIRNDSHSK